MRKEREEPPVRVRVMYATEPNPRVEDELAEMLARLLWPEDFEEDGR